MPLSNSPWRVPILVTVVFGSLVAFDLGSLELLGNSLDETAKWLVILGLAIAFMLSSREMGTMSTAELTAFLTPTIAIIGLEFSETFAGIVEPLGVWFSAFMFMLVLLAYYALTNEQI